MQVIRHLLCKDGVIMNMEIPVSYEVHNQFKRQCFDLDITMSSVVGWFVTQIATEAIDLEVLINLAREGNAYFGPQFPPKSSSEESIVWEQNVLVPWVKRYHEVVVQAVEGSYVSSAEWGELESDAARAMLNLAVRRGLINGQSE